MSTKYYLASYMAAGTGMSGFQFGQLWAETTRSEISIVALRKDAAKAASVPLNQTVILNFQRISKKQYLEMESVHEDKS